MKFKTNSGFLKDLLIYLFFGLIVLFKFWNFLIPKDKIFLAGDFVELMAMRDFFYEQLRNGFLMLWDTHLGTGLPYLSADLGAFYPPDLLIGFFAGFFNIDRLQTLLAIHYWLAGVFTYLYTRQLGFFRTSAVMSALSFMLGGFLLANPHHRNLIQTFIWLPLVLYFLDKALILRKGFWAVIAGLFLAISFLAGHANFFYFFLIWILFYYCFQAIIRIREKSFKGLLQDSSYFLIMALFCLGISAIQLFPTLLSGASTFRQTLDFEWKAQGSYPILNLISFLIPKWFVYTATDLSDQLSYIGIMPLILGLWAAFESKENKTTFFSLVALSSLLLAFGQFTPMYKILYDILPGLDLFRIPARFNCLMTFSLSILAGYGCNLILGDSFREKGDNLSQIIRVIFYFALAAGLLLTLVWFFITSFQGKGGLVSASEVLLEGYILFLFVLGATYLILLGIRKGIPDRALKNLIILLVSLDLFLIGMNFGPFPGGHMSSKDPALFPDSSKAIVGELKKDHELFRIGNSKGLLPPLLRYQENISTYDTESMPNYVSLQFPSEYLQLYFLLEKNPNLVDMLNIKYQIDGSKPTMVPFSDSLRVGREFRNREFDLKAPLSLSKLTIYSFLSYSESISQGSVVACIRLTKQDGSVETIPIRAGIETAEWAIDRPGINFLHRKAQVAKSWDVQDQGFKKNVYFFEWDLKESPGIVTIALQYLWPQGTLEVEKVLLNTQNLKDLIKDRFDLIAPSVFRNGNAFPRVYTLARGKVIPEKENKDKEKEKNLLKELENFNPRDYVILDRLPAGYKEPQASSFSTREAKITHYSPHLIKIVSKTEEDKFLILSDTYNTYWKATIDQKPTTILRANYGLRGIYLPKGNHQIEFSFHYTPFYYGLIITCLSLGVLLIVSFFQIKNSYR
jgi:hypothetical protein